jgi:pilus assembly protein CpaF
MELATIREKVIAATDMSNEPNEEQLHELIDNIMRDEPNYSYTPIALKFKLHQEIYNSMKGLGELEELLSNGDITEIMINGTDRIFIEKNGNVEQTDISFETEEHLNDVIQQIVSSNNKRANESTPIVDTRLKDGSRVNIVLRPVAIDGAAMTIRKFPKENIKMKDLIRWDSITKEAADFLEKLVIAGYNIFISGGTGSGKTTFLNVLSDFIPKSERVVTIEDSAELQLNEIPNLVRMETRLSNNEGTGEITIRDLIKTSLRMRPDRIIVGEVRGGETLDMLQAMNTGHDGSMSTGHANSPKDMLARLETMVLMGVDMPLAAIRSQIASGIDIIVHLGRLRDKSRRVLEIDEAIGIVKNEIKLQPLFIFKEKGESKDVVEGSLVKTANSLINRDKLRRKGL